MKKFRALPPSVQLRRLTEQEDFDYCKAEEMFRKNQTTTSYQSDFCQESKNVKPKNNIFKYYAYGGSRSARNWSSRRR